MSNDTIQQYIFYRILNEVTGKSYVGLTTNEHARRQKHLSDLRHNHHHSSKLQKSFNKYGESVFMWEVIEVVECNDTKAFEIEMNWIARFDSYNNGYNMTSGGKVGTTFAKTCEWNGVLYPSIKDAAKAIGVGKGGMQRRVRLGYKSDEDLRGSGGHNGKTTFCEWNGIQYSSISEAARAIGIDNVTMLNRVRKGYICDDDLKNVKRAEKPTVWNGIEYGSIQEAAQAIGIGAKAMGARLAKGYTCDADVRYRKK